MPLLLFLTSCDPCKRASRKIYQAERICPEVVQRDSQIVVVKIPPIKREISTSRHLPSLKIKAQNLFWQLENAESEQGKYKIIERFIEQNCLDTDTVLFQFDEGTVKLFIQDGKLTANLEIREREVEQKAPLTVLKPQKKQNPLYLWLIIGILVLLILIFIRK